MEEMIFSSFRDPSGFLFLEGGQPYRQINLVYKVNYDLLINSGLYKTLIDERLLIAHEETDISQAKSAQAYRIIKPEPIPFISYPYEWCFSQLKDAALTTLRIQKLALEFGMSLKDASVFNIQFRKGKPVLIDTLSFERYREGRPWVAYGQFCQHFLAPLALMSYKDVRLARATRGFIDGIPLDLASNLLPFSSRLRFSLLSHIHLHAQSQKRFTRRLCQEAELAKKSERKHKMNKFSFLALIDSLETAIRGLHWSPKETVWQDYYERADYSEDAFNHKKQIVAAFLNKINPQLTWDFGANTGLFSRLASQQGSYTISFDGDVGCVEKNYLESRQKGEENILPLVMDLINPSPAIGWANQERMNLVERGPAGATLVLALIHHLAIANNLPFEKIAGFLNKVCNYLIIEFVPKADAMCQKLLSTREDIFPDYNQQNFEREFSKYFTLQECLKISDSQRALYLFKKT